MKKVFLKAFAGLVLFLFGFIMGYACLEINRSPLFLIISVLSVIGGAVLFIQAARGSDVYSQPETGKQETDPSIVIDTTSQQSILDRNNTLMKDWSKTYETREKLKMMKFGAASLEEENNK